MTDDVHGDVHRGVPGKAHGEAHGEAHEAGQHQHAHGNGHVSCEDVLSHVFEFLDRETDDERRAVIAEHLDECSSCLRQFGIEQEFKALVRRRCGGDPTPIGLRDRIKLQLTTVTFEEDGTQVWVERASVERIAEQTPGERPA